MDPTLDLEELIAAMDAVAGDFLCEQRLHHPPVDWVEVAMGLPGTTQETGSDPGPRARKSAAKQGKLILTEDSQEKNQWIAAQAVTHGLLPRVVARLGGQAGEKAPSAWAKLMVSRLMVPPGWFQAQWRTHGGDFRAISKAFGPIPIEFLAQALAQVGADPAMATVVDHGVITHRFSNGPRPRKELYPLEKEVLDYVAHYSRSRRVSGPGMTVWGWPVHVSDWKKEVLRTEFTEEGPPLDSRVRPMED